MWFLAFVLAILHPFAVAGSQNASQEKIWGAAIFTHYGESTPYALPDPTTLTPLGARQLFGAGSALRSRYLSGNEDTRIDEITEFKLDNKQITIFSLVDQFISASAQAFMQGLYPPLANSQNQSIFVDDSAIVNGTVLDFPLNGYQYPEIFTASVQDPNFVHLAGQVHCPMYTIAKTAYVDGDVFKAIKSETDPFYARLYPRVLSDIFGIDEANYLNAYYISDYLNYVYLRNDTVRDLVSLDDLRRAQFLADQFVFATNGDLTAHGAWSPNDHILAVAGRALAYRIVEDLKMNVLSSGSLNKLSLYFGSFEPMVAFAALSNLASPTQPNFYGLPNKGSSIIFELYSLQPESSNQYPSTTDLMIRFLLRNGTNASDISTPLTPYPLFGRGPSQIAIPYDEFVSEMKDIMMSAEEWCNTCSSGSIFCTYYVTGFPPSGDGTGPPRRNLSPAIAGIIGAVVTLVSLGVIIAGAAILLGVRVHRNTTRRRSDLGGFKGANKLASDPDLTAGNSGAANAGILVHPSESPWGPGGKDTPARGHERIGSWEMGDRGSSGNGRDPPRDIKGVRNAIGRASLESEDDPRVSPIADPVKTHECL